jgi:hypothetical protein
MSRSPPIRMPLPGDLSATSDTDTAQVRAPILLLLAAGALGLGPAAVAVARVDAPHPSRSYVERTTSVRIGDRIVRGRRVHMVTWRPGDPRVSPQVLYSARRRTPTSFAAGNRKILAVVNGGTWVFRSGRLIGSVRAGGRTISRRDPDRPAVGFTRAGQLVFGARPAFAADAPHIIAGVAYLFLTPKGGGTRPVTRLSEAPWASASQFSCGPAGGGRTGCFRSNIVQFRRGRIGLVEIAYADIPLAAQILADMGARQALTMDSGGSATIWTAYGRGEGCPRGVNRGRCFGTTAATGIDWQRPVPDVAALTLR